MWFTVHKDPNRNAAPEPAAQDPPLPDLPPNDGGARLTPRAPWGQVHLEGIAKQTALSGSKNTFRSPGPEPVTTSDEL